jgi:hypothetical protein
MYLLVLEVLLIAVALAAQSTKMFTSLEEPCVNKRLGRQCGHSILIDVWWRLGAHWILKGLFQSV